MTEEEVVAAASRIPPARLLELMGYEPRLGWLADYGKNNWAVDPFFPTSLTEPRPSILKACIVFDI